MAVRELDSRPEAYAHFPDDGRYRWLELRDGSVYGYAAFVERDDWLEGHLRLERWGPGVLRTLRRDFEWFKEEARRLNKKRVMGVRADERGGFDPRLFKFARLLGITETCVFQTAGMDV